LAVIYLQFQIRICFSVTGSHPGSCW